MEQNLSERAPTGYGKAPKPKRHKWVPIVIVLIVLAAVAAGALFVYKDRTRPPEASDFDGLYDIDGYTAYEFDGNGGGAMCLGSTTRYAFIYTVTGDVLAFSFEDARIGDVEYTFTMDGKSVTITAADGVTSYTMTKK